MLRNLVAVVIVMSLAAPALAEPQLPRKPRTPTSEPLKFGSPRTGAIRANPCASFGAGFVAVEGTSTCVKVGGAISVGVGGRVR